MKKIKEFMKKYLGNIIAISISLISILLSYKANEYSKLEYEYKLLPIVTMDLDKNKKSNYIIENLDNKRFIESKENSSSIILNIKNIKNLRNIIFIENDDKIDDLTFIKQKFKKDNLYIRVTTGLNENSKFIESDNKLIDCCFLIIENFDRSYTVYMHYTLLELNESDIKILDSGILREMEVYTFEKSEEKWKNELSKKYIEILEAYKKYRIK